MATEKFYIEYRECVKLKRIVEPGLETLNVNDLHGDYEVSQRSTFVRDEV